jgi:hypothetical protein
VRLENRVLHDVGACRQAHERLHQIRLGPRFVDLPSDFREELVRLLVLTFFQHGDQLLQHRQELQLHR